MAAGIEKDSGTQRIAEEFGNPEKDDPGDSPRLTDCPGFESWDY